MAILKKIQDRFIKVLLGKNTVPRGLFDLGRYFVGYGPIHFEYKKCEDGSIVAVSTNFRYGSIVTSGIDAKDLDKNIKDAILTSFGIPSSYAKEAQITRVGQEQKEYAIA